ncbi:MAG: RNA methyltransferase [Oscillospiraceae bacterium]|nr:RNA methyltransferase [Oscillospiraceae bacterium]
MNITSKQNTIIKSFKKPGNFIVIEGAKLTSEAVASGFVPQNALFTQKAKAVYPDLFKSLSAFVISDDLSEYISDTKTPQGVFVMFNRRETHIDFSGKKRLMLLDSVQDPGNVGAILRSCEAFGFDGAILSDDSADMYSPKVIRASAGSALRLPVQRGNIKNAINEIKKSGFKVYAAALDENAIPLNRLSTVNCQLSTVRQSSIAVVIGNEGKGVSKETLALCDNKLYIPIKGAESLNAAVAAGIICYELTVDSCRLTVVHI